MVGLRFSGVLLVLVLVISAPGINSSFVTTKSSRPVHDKSSSCSELTDCLGHSAIARACQSDRRFWFQQTLAAATGVLATTATAALAAPSTSSTPSKSRTEGYAVQRSEKEWASILSRQQYNILRLGGTERQRSSILENEERAGTYVCAGCRTPLFASASKFKSGTGWPSFAAALPGSVEILRGEVRCDACGGHLGDVFDDGWRFLSTPASKTGKRYCIDGAALVFRPDGEGMEEVAGDRPPPNKVIQYEPAAYREPRKTS